MIVVADIRGHVAKTRIPISLLSIIIRAVRIPFLPWGRIARFSGTDPESPVRLLSFNTAPGLLSVRASTFAYIRLHTSSPVLVSSHLGALQTEEGKSLWRSS